MAKIKKRFILEIEVDEDAVQQKYPNYRYNYNNAREFIQAREREIVMAAGVDLSRDGMETWGYSIKVKEE